MTNKRQAMLDEQRVDAYAAVFNGVYHAAAVVSHAQNKHDARIKLATNAVREFRNMMKEFENETGGGQ